MTVPRPVPIGGRYLITRRCTQRQFWLVPTELTNQILAFCLAWAGEITGVKIHAFCAMSNHWHMVITDVNGELPEFLRIAHVYTSKCINSSYGRWENLWASEQPSAVHLEDDEDVLDKIAYVLTNPVEAELVKRGSLWPGLRTSPRQVLGSSKAIARPPVFFRENGPVPEEIRLHVSRPAIFQELDDHELAAKIEATVEDREARIRARVAKERRSFMGVKAILAQRPDASPNTLEPRRQLSPRIAAKNKWRRVEALRRVKAFLAAYREAYRRFKAGMRDVVFPAGTYALRFRFGVAVAKA